MQLLSIAITLVVVVLQSSWVPELHRSMHLSLWHRLFQNPLAFIRSSCVWPCSLQQEWDETCPRFPPVWLLPQDVQTERFFLLTL